MIATVIIFLSILFPLPVEQQSTTHHHNANRTHDHQQFKHREHSVKTTPITRDKTSILTSYETKKLDKHVNQEANIIVNRTL